MTDVITCPGCSAVLSSAAPDIGGGVCPVCDTPLRPGTKSHAAMPWRHQLPLSVARAPSRRPRERSAEWSR